MSSTMSCLIKFSVFHNATFQSAMICTAPELETLHFTKPQRLVRSLEDTAAMQQNESSVCYSPETQNTAEGGLNKNQG